MNEIIKLNDTLLTTPSKKAFGGYDAQGNQIEIDVYLLKLLLTDGRVYIHPLVGDRERVHKLENRIRVVGQVNLSYWHKARDKQEYN